MSDDTNYWFEHYVQQHQDPEMALEILDCKLGKASQDQDWRTRCKEAADWLFQDVACRKLFDSCFSQFEPSQICQFVQKFTEILLQIPSSALRHTTLATVLTWVRDALRPPGA